MRIDEPAADLAVALALASSYKDQPVRADTVLIGEVGLSGELRMVGQMQARLKEAAKLGFKRAVIPQRVRKGEPWPAGIEVIEARGLREAIAAALLEAEPEKKGK
jgi:DNA repair protein RadA/Sms